MSKKDCKGKEYELFTLIEFDLLDIIVNSDVNQENIKYFQENICNIFVDRHNLYRLSVKYKRYLLTDILVNSEDFDINDSKNDVYSEIIGAILWGKDYQIKRYFEDGFTINSRTEIESILNMYIRANDVQHDMEVYNYFVNLYKSMNN